MHWWPAQRTTALARLQNLRDRAVLSVTLLLPAIVADNADNHAKQAKNPIRATNL
jgi:hypothetical protein